jgi:prophage DNA circulation protein
MFTFGILAKVLVWGSVCSFLLSTVPVVENADLLRLLNTALLILLTFLAQRNGSKVEAVHTKVDHAANAAASAATAAADAARIAKDVGGVLRTTSATVERAERETP